MQLEVKTILNRIQRFSGFIYRDIRLRCRTLWRLRIEVSIEPHGKVRAKCGQCLGPAPTYDHLPERQWLFVPLWAFGPIFSTRPGGCNVLNTAWWLSTFPGARANGR